MVSRTELPADPFALLEHPEFTPAARRELSVLGAPVELLYLPERKARPGVPTAGRPAFATPFVERILAEEGRWRGCGIVLTGNRYPFSTRQAMLWAEAPVREPDRAMLAAVLQLEEKVSGAVLLNSIGAAASITRCHLHLLAERLPFLEHFEAVPATAPALPDPPAGAELRALAPPFPGVALGVLGPAAARAEAVHRLLEARTSPAFNLVSQHGTTWVFPRSPVETPGPHFPHALGAAELWGRWCFSDREPFEAATADDLEAALRTGCYPPA